MGISVTGDKAILKAFDRMSKKDSKAAIRKATRAGQKINQAAVKAQIPKDTGALRKSIKVRSMRRSRVRQGTTVVSIGPRYLAFVELGTVRREAMQTMKISEEKNREKVFKETLETLSKELRQSWYK